MAEGKDRDVNTLDSQGDAVPTSAYIHSLRIEAGLAIDDVANGPAFSIGISGVLVRTGKFRPSDLDGAGQAPNHLIDDIGHLPELLGHLARGQS
jgi:hypothetical protein